MINMSNHLKILNLVYSHEFLFPFSIIFYEKCHGRLEDLALYKYFYFYQCLWITSPTYSIKERETLNRPKQLLSCCLSSIG